MGIALFAVSPKQCALSDDCTPAAGAGVRERGEPQEKLRKLETALVGANGRPSLQPEAMPLLAALLSLPHPDGYPSLSFSPQKQKEKTYEVLVAWLCEEATQRATCYAWEDLHWADPSTLELLILLLAQVPTIRLLTVLTCRPEFTPSWGTHSYLSQLTLGRLGKTHVEEMVKEVTGSKTLPAEVVEHIISKTDGVPLFVEEVTKAVLESGESLGSNESEKKKLLQAIPVTLHDALMARLDRLEEGERDRATRGRR